MQRLPCLILASTSRYRRALLERLRVPFETLAPAWAEVRLADPDATVRANALGKARAAARTRPEAAVLASDQVGWCAGRMLEKPGIPEAACDQLAWLAGREHTLHTCVVLREPGGRETQETIVARLRMRPLRPDQVEAYVRLDSPLDCAGSYKTESLGIALFESLSCADPTAIEGLPLIAVGRLLRGAGWEIPPLAERTP
jgi:septum formation protein